MSDMRGGEVIVRVAAPLARDGLQAKNRRHTDTTRFFRSDGRYGQMSTRWFLSLPTLALMLSVVPHTLWATEEAAADAPAPRQSDSELQFLRVRRNDDQHPVALETAVTRFVGQNDSHQPIQVDLVGAVHVGERQYYEELNRQFATYDAVLYELVAPEGTRDVRDRSGGSHPVSVLQNLMKSVLKLEFQLDHIDYAPSHMVHADMSPEEFSESMKERGESFLKIFLRAMGQAMSMPSQQKSAPSDLELIVALLAKDRAERLKRLMAEQFENMEGQLDAINGPDGSTIITERNKKALSVLRQQMATGKRRFAIFYGAGHLSDMAERLQKEFGLRQDTQNWLVAWNIEPPSPADKTPAEASAAPAATAAAPEETASP